MQTDPYALPRPYPMVAAMLEYRTGEPITAEWVRQLELRALVKIRAALAADPELRAALEIT